jgi:hypothetical protein
MNNESNSIMIFTSDKPEKQEEYEVTRGPEKHFYNTISTTVNGLQKNMNKFLKSLDTILKNSPQEVGGLKLDEVEINAQIDGKGNIGIAGILGAEVSTQGGIKIVLRKK